MRKNILVYGLIAGVVAAALMLTSVNYFSHCKGNVDYNTSMVIGYASMLLAFSLVFVGVRNYRNNYNGGVISFGKAFKVGLLMVLVAATFYVAAWLVDYYCFIPDFAEIFSARMLEDIKASGASAADVAKQTKDLADFVVMFKNPFFNAMMTYMEILPVGIVVALISALILKRKALPAGSPQ